MNERNPELIGQAMEEQLLEAAREVENKGGRVVYMDTDGLVTHLPESVTVERKQGPALGLRFRRDVWAHAQYQRRVLERVDLQVRRPMANRAEHVYENEMTRVNGARAWAWGRLVDMSAAQLGAVIGHARSFEQALACVNDWVRCHASEAS